MIGVVANPAEHDAVREFFELFKTPWEFYRRDRQYEVLLCSADDPVDETAKLILFYAGTRVQFDDEHQIQTGRQRSPASILSYKRTRIPIYGNAITFPEEATGLLTHEDSQECSAYLDRSGDRFRARIGYDIFKEVHTLLTVGQPPTNANLPALDLHIAFLRDLITGCGVPLVEVPPAPDKHRFIACLTHDVDHPSICQHKWDHTMFGFLYRAVLGSLRNFIRGRIPRRTLLANWTAALKLPFVYLGLAKDFWLEFDGRYLAMEKGLPSTFFVIPFKDRPGRNATGLAPRHRASRYGAADIASHIQTLTSADREIGLHGIDAWLDSSNGQKELEEIRRLTEMQDIGVRMHWLYFDERSPVTLEKAGADYDSTVGYNGTVGYRAGTSQAYKPFQAIRLLELPLMIMDTALFFPGYLDLSFREASKRVDNIINHAVQFGGTVTVNWHDRSVAPERCWDEFYTDLVDELKSKEAWFATGKQAVSWFRKRRSVVFETVDADSTTVRVKVAAEADDKLPGLLLRVHRPGEQPQDTAISAGTRCVDLFFAQKELQNINA